MIHVGTVVCVTQHSCLTPVSHEDSSANSKESHKVNGYRGAVLESRQPYCHPALSEVWAK